jgi:hypothetical protein
MLGTGTERGLMIFNMVEVEVEAALPDYTIGAEPAAGGCPRLMILPRRAPGGQRSDTRRRDRADAFALTTHP